MLILMFLLFLGLQLGGAIDWPWYAVGAPLMVQAALFVLVIVLALVVGSAPRKRFIY